MTDINPNILKNRAFCIKLLKSFIQLCESNDIQYQMAYGSALGTIRHHGFIPWDKNIDVLMTLPDYNRFSSIIKEKLPSDLELKSFFFGNDMGRLIPRIIPRSEDDPSIFFNPNIDISVLCGTSSNRLLSWCHLKVAYFNNKAFRLKNVSSVKNSILLKVLKSLLAIVPNALFIKVQNLIMNLFDYEKSRYVISIETVYGNEVFPKSITEDVSDYDFENIKVKLTRNYDVYLSTLYGDYMKPVVFKKHQVHSTAAN